MQKASQKISLLIGLIPVFWGLFLAWPGLFTGFLSDDLPLLNSALHLPHWGDPYHFYPLRFITARGLIEVFSLSNPIGFHAFLIFLFCLNIYFFFAWLKKGLELKTRVAFFGALFFASHAYLYESVFWITTIQYQFVLLLTWPVLFIIKAEKKDWKSRSLFITCIVLTVCSEIFLNK